MLVKPLLQIFEKSCNVTQHTPSTARKQCFLRHIMSNSTTEILQKARSLLAEPGRWTRGAFARDAKGNIVHPYSHAAKQFDIAGACLKINSHAGIPRALWLALAERVPTPGKRFLESYNDAIGTHLEQVLSLFDRAIVLDLTGK